MKTYETTSIKTGKINFLNEDEYKKLIELGIDKKFKIREAIPIRSIIKKPPEIIITNKKESKK